MAKKAKAPPVATRGERALISAALPGLFGIGMPGQVRLASREQQPPRPPAPKGKRKGR
jgi:hypothetical protein